MEVKKIKEFMKKGEIYLMPETQPDLFGLKEYVKYILDRSLPYAQFTKIAAFFKGIRKGKTLKDTVAVFKVVVGPNRSVVFGAREEMKKKENYRIEEATIPIPQLERMIVNKSLVFLNDYFVEERIKDVFEAVEGKRPPKTRRRMSKKAQAAMQRLRDEDREYRDADAARAASRSNQPAPLQENKIKIRLIKK
jgi:hypothetical protein